MAKSITSLLLLLVLAGTPASGQGIRPSFAPDEFLIIPSDGPSPAAVAVGADLDLAALGVRVAGRARVVETNARGVRRVKVLNVPKGVSPAAEIGDIIRQLRASAAVKIVQKNFYYYYQAAEPNDPRLSQLEYLDTISAPEAWPFQKESPNVVVAVIDTGIFLKHEDLHGNIFVNQIESDGTAGVDDDGNGFVDDINGWDFVKNHASPDVVKLPSGSFDIHGSHVAGTIGAVGNNGIGTVGISRKVRLMPLKIFEGETPATSFSIASAIDYAVANRASIINASWGGNDFDPLMRESIKRAGDAEILFVAAAGNLGRNIDATPFYPASYDLQNIISVAASDSSDHRARFSNFGASNTDLAAPGVGILSTVPVGSGDVPESGYEDMNGTSMATPIVTGAAALARARYPALSASEIRNLLVLSADNVTALGGLIGNGGRLNLHKALSNQPEAIRVFLYPPFDERLPYSP